MSTLVRAVSTPTQSRGKAARLDGVPKPGCGSGSANAGPSTPRRGEPAAPLRMTAGLFWELMA